MSFFGSMNTSATGMTAQRLRMDTISQNIANVETTRTASGQPYRRKTVIFQEMEDQNKFKNVFNKYINDYKNGGVKVTQIVEDQSPLTKVYNPSHPDADAEGYVSMPNVNIVAEMTNLISANRSYEANVTAFNASKAMITKALEIGR